MTPAAVAVIRPTALQHNLRQVRAAAPGSRVLAVIKANAYGHGLLSIARILADTDVDGFAVARLDEALQLRAAGIRQRIVVLGGCSTVAELRAAADAALDIVVHSGSQVPLLLAARLSSPVWCWLKVETGMGRLGLDPGGIHAIRQGLLDCPAVRGVTMMTHFGCADDRSDPLTAQQFRVFTDSLGDWAGDVSVANSATILQWPEIVASLAARAGGGGNWVRPGIMLYGASPIRTVPAAEIGLVPAMSFESRLISVKKVGKGARVGYGGHWVAARDTVLGIAAAGYADGYPWQVAAGTPVGVRGRTAPLVGRVSMDMITIDLTEVPDAVVGDPVVLWGDGPSVEDVAAAARTIPWTLMTGINRRVAVRVEDAAVSGAAVSSG